MDALDLAEGVAMQEVVLTAEQFDYLVSFGFVALMLVCFFLGILTGYRR